MICNTCETEHYYSYSIKKDSHYKDFYVLSKKDEFFQMTAETLFEIKLFQVLLNDILFKIASLESFCNSYNNSIGSLNHRILNQKRLQEGFLLYHCIIYYLEFISTNISELKSKFIFPNLF